MAIKVVLLKKIGTLGDEGDIVSVKEGYARNFLLLKGFARLATEDAIRDAEKIKEAKVEKERTKVEEAKKEADKLAGISLTLKKKSAKGHLFGSVKATEILQLLKEKGVEVKKSQLHIGSIKEIGEHSIEISFAAGIKEKVILNIIDETSQEK